MLCDYIAMIKKKVIIIIFLLFFTANISAQDSENNGFAIIGVQTGIKNIEGYYDDQLDPGYFIQIFSFFPLYYISDNLHHKYLIGDINLSYSNYTLSHSKSSDLILSSACIGPLLYYPEFRYFDPFIGINAGFEYLYLTTSKTNISERTFKPSFAIKAGFMIPFESNFIISLATEYKVFELSKSAFHDFKYGLAVGYNLKFYDEEEITAIRSALEYDALYDEGIDLFNKGDGKRARVNFRKIAKFDRNFRDINNYLEILKNNEEKFNKALGLINEHRLEEAIPILIETGKYFIEARDKLAEVRSMLMAEIKNIENKAVKAYDNKEYSECLNILNRLQMIDPENETYKLYYPKAVKRYKAIKLLE